MKKIINGKTYNTETAKKLANWDNEIYGSFDSIEETLYQKRTGEFFLAGEGGASTIRPPQKTAQKVGQELSPSPIPKQKNGQKPNCPRMNMRASSERSKKMKPR